MTARSPFHANGGGRSRRALLVLMATLLLLLFGAPAAFAGEIASGGDDGDKPAGPTPRISLCVEGLVINHREQPLSDWTVTASDGSQALSDVSNRNGRVQFDLEAFGPWQFTLQMQDDWQAVTPESVTVTVRHSAATCAQIVFKVRQGVPITVLKIDDAHHPLSGWKIMARPIGDDPFAAEVSAVTGDNGEAYFDLTPGLWEFEEIIPPDVNCRPVLPTDGIQVLDVTAPGPHRIRFKNICGPDKGCIEVIKKDVPPDAKGESFGLPDWPITVYYANGDVAAQGLTDAFGRVTFHDLPFGPYVVHEQILPEWEPVSASVFDVIVSPYDKSCQVVEFYNRQAERAFCFEGIKLYETDEGYFGLSDWTISATPLEAGDEEPAPVTTDGEGYFRFDFPENDYRVPGSTYRICETVPDGWVNVSPRCFEATLPHSIGACVNVGPFINTQVRNHEPVKHDDDKPAGKDDVWTPAPVEDDHKDDDHSGDYAHKDDYKEDYKDDDHGMDKPADGACSAYHTVKRGEGLSSIGPKYGLTAQGVLNANPWIRQQKNLWVHAGQKVCIP